jgi:hypothetical protein
VTEGARVGGSSSQPAKERLTGGLWPSSSGACDMEMHNREAAHQLRAVSEAPTCQGTWSRMGDALRAALGHEDAPSPEGFRGFKGKPLSVVGWAMTSPRTAPSTY